MFFSNSKSAEKSTCEGCLRKVPKCYADHWWDLLGFLAVVCNSRRRNLSRERENKLFVAILLLVKEKDSVAEIP